MPRKNTEIIGIQEGLSERVEEAVIKRRLRLFMILSLGLGALLTGCPDIDVDKYMNGDVDAGSKEPTTEKPEKKEKAKNGVSVVPLKSQEMDKLSDKKKEFLKIPGAVYDKYTGNVICPPRVVWLMEEPLVEFPFYGAKVDPESIKTDGVNIGDIEVDESKVIKFKLKKSVYEALLKADKEMRLKTGVGIDLRDALRTNETQDFFYTRKIREGRSYDVAQGCRGAHENGQAIDVNNWRQARDYLIGAGFLDSVCSDEVHWEYRQNGFDSYAQGCSAHNKRWYYGTGTMGKVKRKIGKIIKKTGKAGKGIKKFFHRKKKR